MGQQKEELLEREEMARQHAPKCEICVQPLMTYWERSKHLCAGCDKAMNGSN
jgi:hypothetical protein